MFCKKSLFITGTDTGVGKTVVTAGIAGNLASNGYKVGLMKPIQTGCRREGDKLVSPDLEFLLKAYEYGKRAAVNDSKRKMSLGSMMNRDVLISKSISADVDIDSGPENMVSKKRSDYFPNTVYCFEPPVSPNLAAQLSGEIIYLEEIMRAYRQITSSSDITLVEGIGGLMVPLNDNYLVRDLILEMNLPVVIVARPGLGTINHTLLTLETARKSGIKVMGVLINGLRTDKAGLSEKHNPEIIARVGQTKILGLLPFIPDLDVESGRLGQLIKVSARHIDLSFLLSR